MHHSLKWEIVSENEELGTDHEFGPESSLSCTPLRSARIARDKRQYRECGFVLVLVLVRATAL